MEKLFSLPQLTRFFSRKTFATLALAFTAYFGYRAFTFLPEYQCVLIVQPPLYSEVLGPRAPWLLREHATILSGGTISISQRGDLLAFVAIGSTPDHACAKLQGVKDYLQDLNTQVPKLLPALQREQELLNSFITSLLQCGDTIYSKEGYRPDRDKTLPDVLMRKIQLDRLLVDYHSISFKIVRDSTVGSSPRLNYLNDQILYLYGLTLLASVLSAFLFGYFRFLILGNAR